MSSSLLWRITPPDNEPIGGDGYPLKGIIADFFFNGDASSNTEKVTVSTNDQTLITFLEGYLTAKDDEGIREFLRDLNKYQQLDVWIER